MCACSCVCVFLCACAYACEWVCHKCVYTCVCMCAHISLMLLSLVLYSMPGLLLIYNSRWSWVPSDFCKKWWTEREYEHGLETPAKFIRTRWVWLLTHLASGALTSGLPVSQRRTPCHSYSLVSMKSPHRAPRRPCLLSQETEQWAKHMSALPEIQVNTSTPADHKRELCCQLSGT